MFANRICVAPIEMVTPMPNYKERALLGKRGRGLGQSPQEFLKVLPAALAVNATNFIFGSTKLLGKA